jgi:hypothetical protein
MLQQSFNEGDDKEVKLFVSFFTDYNPVVEDFSFIGDVS